MRRRDWAGLTIVLAQLCAAVGCGVDSYLTCGAPCEDGGAGDATLTDSSTDGTTQDAAQDAGQDVTQNKDTGSPCGNDSGFCQNSTQCCASAPICNAGHRCATSCGAVDASCSSSGGDTCCQPSFCNQGHCSACFEAGAPCSEDWQCCAGSCQGSACQ